MSFIWARMSPMGQDRWTPRWDAYAFVVVVCLVCGVCMFYLGLPQCRICLHESIQYPSFQVVYLFFYRCSKG